MYDEAQAIAVKRGLGTHSTTLQTLVKAVGAVGNGMKIVLVSQ